MHLFIVSEQTLPFHLEYQFAGVRKKNDCSWSNYTNNASAERAQASQYADICRVHQGDEILFYLETPSHDLGREGGRFLGIFEVTSPIPFYEASGTYLSGPLGMPLIYRLQIQPKEIFELGLTEWQAMDEMTDFRSVHDIPWTLIYRKMQGGRGCTPLLPHEARLVRRMLDLRNAGQRLQPHNVGYNSNTVSLTNTGNTTPYTGQVVVDRIDNRLRWLMAHPTRQWELHLQAYLMQEIGRNAALTAQFFPGVQVDWIGNEIYAGAGMQSIDILAYTSSQLNSFIHLIELKSVQVSSEAASQLNRYIKWLKAHIPDVSVHQIIPTIVGPTIAQSFHDSIQVYLRGHGITQYRTVTVDNQLNFHQNIHIGF